MSHAITPSGRAVNPWWIGMTLTIATFMELLDTSIANVSLPHIAGGLGTSLDEATWVLTSYLVANAVVLPLSAWLSRVFGRKNYYMGCVALFTASSFLCGTAPNLGLLIFFRILQGIAGGGLAPSEQAMLVDTFPPAKRAAAFGLYSMAIVLAPAFFHQCPGRYPVALSHQPAGHRSTRLYRGAPEDQGRWSESD
jgi:MFS transporter, DHA2 family, multidrug resistance protein